MDQKEKDQLRKYAGLEQLQEAVLFPERKAVEKLDLSKARTAITKLSNDLGKVLIQLDKTEILVIKVARQFGGTKMPAILGKADKSLTASLESIAKIENELTKIFRG